jgi:hypothetical protein
MANAPIINIDTTNRPRVTVTVEAVAPFNINFGDGTAPQRSRTASQAMLQPIIQTFQHRYPRVSTIYNVTVSPEPLQPQKLQLVQQPVPQPPYPSKTVNVFPQPPVIIQPSLG